ncbi:MAG: SDR family NAD(P)-dependent oxidoreductase [Actinomycetota bacterium]
MITGASSGIGAALAEMHARDGWDVVMVNRSAESSRPAVEQIVSTHPDVDVDVVEADLADHDAIARAAEELRSLGSVDRFVNNAGVLLGERVMSRHGVEMHAQVNTLAPYLFGRLVAPSMTGGLMAVITTSGIDRAKTLAVDELADPPTFKKLFGPYVQSKLAASALMPALAREYPEVTFRSAEPGAVKTPMTSGDGMPGWLVPIRNLFFSTPEKGAERIYEALDAEAPNGSYMRKGKPRAVPGDAGSQAVQEALVEWCRATTGT